MGLFRSVSFMQEEVFKVPTHVSLVRKLFPCLFSMGCSSLAGVSIESSAAYGQVSWVPAGFSGKD